MSKTLLLAEKPDQARTFYVPMLERLSGESFQKQQGYYESRSYYVSWFFGHLLEAIKPEDYQDRYKTWRLEDLPIIPEKMIYRFKQGAEEQGHCILKLSHDSDAIICGTDPDREGQGIFDTFMNYYKIEKPRMKRLWATSLTDKDLEKAWSRQKDLREYANLSLARELRADSDWLVGMNATRAYSVISKSRMPVGRVLTATLALIVNRDREVEEYKESFYYQLKAQWSNLGFVLYHDDHCKFEDESMLRFVALKVRNREFKLQDFKEERKLSNPPKPFNLPDLQKEANRKLGFSLEKTLKTAQELYEKKLTTYPRTDSPYLPKSDLSDYHGKIRAVATPEQASLLLDASAIPACVKDTESPHTALIITGEPPANLSEDQRKLYVLVRDRFIIAFMRPHEYIEYSLSIADSDNHVFKANARFDIDPGFRKVHTPDEDEDQNTPPRTFRLDEAALRATSAILENPDIVRVQRTRPKYYTPATLITAMQTCGRSLSDEKYRTILSEVKGIGTPATQAIYPENLKKYEFIVEEKGHFKSTPKGRALIEAISPSLKTPELTAEWELKLRLVESGALSGHDYKREFREFVRSIVDEASAKAVAIQSAMLKGPGHVCPACAGAMHMRGNRYSCGSCGLTIWESYCGRKLTQPQLMSLLTKGRTSPIKGFVSAKNGKKFDAALVIDKEAKKAVFEFQNRGAGK